MKNKRMLSNILLAITSIIWGSAFVSQRVGVEANGPFTFNAARYILSAVFIFTLERIFHSRNIKKNPELANEKDPIPWFAMITCGTIMFFAATLQQVGIVYTSAGKAAFITTLYILLIPIIGIFLGKKTRVLTWVAVFVGAAGLALLTLKENFSIEKGDFIVLIGAFFWAFHILAIDYFLSKDADPLKLSYGQLFVVAIFSTVCTVALETPTVSGLVSAIPAILFAGIMSGGVGYTFQIIAQKNTEPVIASLILSTEAAFGALAGWLFLGELMTSKEILGCILMFVAIILSQLPSKDEKAISE